MNQKSIDEKYMRRCIAIARNGLNSAKPNPSVGAVIVSADNRIIGEGYTSSYGGPHAEVNAFASVKPEDEHLLADATLYVSLEPCSHYGKTPPCADLVVRKGVKRCVCGCIDPFSEVQGRGIKKLRDAGIDVTVGVLEKECKASNKRFFTFNMLHRPYIILKWAQTINGFMGGKDRLHISTPFTQMLVHQLRAECDAILIGRGTLESDHPQLNVRDWYGPSPERIVLSHNTDGIPEGFLAFTDIDSVLTHLYQEKKQSLIVEGGAQILQAFIEAELWDEIRIETSPFTITEGIKSPILPYSAQLVRQKMYDGNRISWYEHL
jgi:diaminohydroxyphosphoribosylaminopyrimidine deaminase/5-amino-6-(5-phosphoribosylamino)uracil reductase